jgi:hypothetical protein
MQQYHSSQQPDMMSSLPLQYQAGPSSMPNIPPQALMNFLNQQNNAPFGTPPYERFSLALVDAMKAQIMPSASWDPGSGQTLPQSLFNPQMILSATQPSQDIQTSNAFGAAPGLATDAVYESRASPSRSDLPPSLRRKSPVTSRSPSKASKGKGKATTPTSFSTSLPESPWISHGTTASASPRATLQSGTLFTSETGEELSFFVQIDLNNRFSIVSAIKVSVVIITLESHKLKAIRKTGVESLTTIQLQTMRYFIPDLKHSVIF